MSVYSEASSRASPASETPKKRARKLSRDVIMTMHRRSSASISKVDLHSWTQAPPSLRGGTTWWAPPLACWGPALFLIAAAAFAARLPSLVARLLLAAASSWRRAPTWSPRGAHGGSNPCVPWLSGVISGNLVVIPEILVVISRVSVFILSKVHG